MDTQIDARHRGFTLVELLVVITIIVVLAGLILGTSSYVQKKGARSRTEAEIAAMSAALESYKADNGIYPTNTASTETFNPTSATATDYSSSSRFLYDSLAGNTIATSGSRTAAGKSYMSFKPNMLTPKDQAQPVSAIVDAFGNSYGYSTAKSTNPIGTVGNNPTYDLWSIADGTMGTTQTKWIKNW